MGFFTYYWELGLAVLAGTGTRVAACSCAILVMPYIVYLLLEQLNAGGGSENWIRPSCVTNYPLEMLCKILWRANSGVVCKSCWQSENLIRELSLGKMAQTLRKLGWLDSKKVLVKFHEISDLKKSIIFNDSITIKYEFCAQDLN